jgi:epoxyqueuosine reductase
VLALKERLRQAARDLGLVRLGFASPGPLPRGEFLARWLSQGMAAEMTFFAPTAALRIQPRTLFPPAQTALVAVASYAPVPAEATGEHAEPLGQVAGYARGRDYHRVLFQRLGALADGLNSLLGQQVNGRIVVDTAPLLERELAMASGVGFIGKNTMLITPGVGSYTVLGTLLIDVELPPDRPGVPHCGSCRLCLEACPTGALVAPYLLDARRCLSYLTIEHRGTLDPALQRKFSPWLFGCDVCQGVCPYNRRAGRRPLEAPDADLAPSDGLSRLRLSELLDLTSSGYRRLVRARPLERISRARLIRNAIVLAANYLHAGQHLALLVPRLERLRQSPHPLIAETAHLALRG